MLKSLANLFPLLVINTLINDTDETHYLFCFCNFTNLVHPYLDHNTEN